jgi:hypothetical protein
LYPTLLSCRLRGVTIYGKQAAIVMDFYERQSLGEEIKRRGRGGLPQQDVLRCLGAGLRGCVQARFGY